MKPRKQNIRRYDKAEQGTRVFKIEELDAEIPYKVTAAGNVYVGSEFVGQNVKVLVFRRKEYETNDV